MMLERYNIRHAKQSRTVKKKEEKEREKNIQERKMGFEVEIGKAMERLRV
jgi:hypothetical protein